MGMPRPRPIALRYDWIAVGVLTAAVIAMPPLDAFQAVPPSMCRVHGTITSTMRPLPGVSVVFKSGDAVATATSTETDGTYQAILQPATYRVSVALGGFSAAERDISIEADACGKTIDFELALLPRTPRSTTARPVGRLPLLCPP